jgi:hypothetical protein
MGRQIGVRERAQSVRGAVDTEAKIKIGWRESEAGAELGPVGGCASICVRVWAR